MGLSPGTRLGPYEIVAPLSAGGMGEVYRARDTRLDRTVAIKVLPPGVTSTPEARVRFDREARAISQLNHPNICTLHDVGRQGDTSFLVMELVSGGSLRDLLLRKALSLEQVVTLGIEIADALETAHARGIVHRDLKPGNVLLTERGQAKVADFGLAIVRQRGAKASGPKTTAATETYEHMTSPGQVVGTVAYMSPEQARGEELDARSDVFSLGAVLYEMVSGHMAFEGSSQAVVFEAILNRMPPPASMLRQGVPGELDRIIGKALEKDRELRYQTAGEVRTDLMRLRRDWASPLPGGSSSGVPSDALAMRRDAMLRRRRMIRIALTAAAVATFAGAIYLAARREPGPGPVRLSLESPRNVVSVVGGSVRMAPDGRRVAFTAIDSTGARQIWLSSMDGTPPRPLPGTEGAWTPFWSPDGRSVGFWAQNKVKRTEIAGGQPVTICDDSTFGNGSWGSAGIILIGSDPAIAAVSASGGQLAQVTWGDRSRGELAWAPCYPQFLPDGKNFIYLGPIEEKPESTALRLGRLGSRKSKILAVGDLSRVEYVPPGYLLYQRGRTILAQPFDAKRLRLAGDAFPVVDDVVRKYPNGDADFAASAGTLAYRDEIAAGRQRLVWMDREGRETGTLGRVGHYVGGLALSPDGARLAVSVVEPGEASPDIWILDVLRDVPMRLTSDPGINRGPIWSPNGATIFFTNMKHNPGLEVWMKPASGIGEARRLPVPPASPQCVTPDGRSLIARKFESTELFKVSLDENSNTTPLGLRGDQLSLSRDGKWLAYQSDEAGDVEVYVVDFPGLTAKWRVSTDGGDMPHWSADGRELFFLAPGGKLMAAPVFTSPSFRTGKPARVLGTARQILQYVPTSDGRFLVLVNAREERLPPMKVVLNWQAGIRQR